MNINIAISSIYSISILCYTNDNKMKEVEEVGNKVLQNIIALSVIIKDYEKGKISSIMALQKINILKCELVSMKLRFYYIKDEVSQDVWTKGILDYERRVSTSPDLTDLMKQTYRALKIIYDTQSSKHIKCKELIISINHYVDLLAFDFSIKR